MGGWGGGDSWDDDSWGGGAGDWGSGKGGGKASSGKAGTKDKGAGVKKQSVGPDVQEVLGELIGTIKSFNEKSGYGFIHCPEVTELGYNDVFLHHQQKGDFNVGDTVAFTGYLNKKGQVQAMDLKPAQGTKRKLQ